VVVFGQQLSGWVTCVSSPGTEYLLIGTLGIAGHDASRISLAWISVESW
jgi:hypothetical protein